ncbi:hypothetical protein Tsubulata_040605 [Turnera subulata]|uniref:Chitinase domain-containing protein 1 n=1 Tax=Turnera subulata TaxID=218843 RepID=A0A9Q0FHZ1_9ROSI|nr:hypothetical protein Tsubulata_040605 [Turnera subulata]
MAKRRVDRRVAPSPDIRQGRADASVRANQYSESAASDRKLIAIYVFFFIVLPAVSVFVYVTRYGPNTNAKPRQPTQNLVKTDLDYQEILRENSRVSKNESHRHYTYPVLAYITPWNSKGYDIAKRFTNKFTHLSPVWYDLKSQGSGLVMEGRHNADQGWISELRKNGDALVLPRVVLEAYPKELLGKKNLREKAIDIIVSECKEMQYDGIVLESWSRWAAYGILHDPQMRNKALQFIKQLGHALHSVSSGRSNKQPLQLVYVIGPPHSEKLQVHDFGPEDLQSLGDAVDGFSLMTYDFSGPQNPGPNAPLPWIQFVLQVLLGSTGKGGVTPAYKIFLGINFYGNDFMLSEGSGGGAITGRDYLKLLEKYEPKLQWEKNSGEHFFLYVDDDHISHAVFYPSLTSISMRLEEARLRGTGISIWEIGQGVQECLSRTFQGGVALLSSLLGTGVAKALTYEEALEQTVGSSPIDEFDASGILTSVTSFAADNPTVVAGGVTVLAVPLILSLVLNKPSKPWGVESAKKAYAVLGEDKSAQLLDIRAPVELKKVGSPDVKSLGKKPVAIVYKGEDKPGFLKKMALKFKEPENTTLFILDKFDGNSELVAELVTANGFKAAYAIKDGAEGPRGWLSSGLPWIEPRKALSLDFSSLSDSISDAFGEGSNAVPATLAVAAAAGLGLLAFSEDRKTTLKQVDEFVNTKVAPKELVDEIKQIGKALLPPTTTSKALPAPTEASSEPAPSNSTVEKPEPSPQINSVPQTEVKTEPVAGISRPLSPYSAYPDLKPPTSPSPSQPQGQINSMSQTEVKAESVSGISSPLSPYPTYPDLKPPTSPSPSQP